ncbi:hypothetical protein M413DRAFT_373009 [Hebeloma cylindrosporum]|uniref:Uncharacterized protein n=1 Tax=Hebeloma cylindrosporum TaxID=76867 RepID=A0A0C2Y2C5_HEBCY|nr:hypothetical protein M413DRAFT_373009 [Hebeloma cylindrosporum h7]
MTNWRHHLLGKVPALQTPSKSQPQLPVRKYFYFWYRPSHMQTIAFAAIKPSAGAIEKQEKSTDLWLWDRLTVRISRIPFSDPQDRSRLEINAKIQHYDKMMAMEVPKQWKELDNMPDCDKRSIETRTQLHQRLSEYAATNSTVVVDGELQSALQCFANHPEPLYNAIKAAQKYQQQEESGFNVPEAEKRRVWDDLLHAYTSSPDDSDAPPDEPRSPSYHHDKTLRCPKNDRVKNPSRYPPLEHAHIQNKLATNQAFEGANQGVSSVIGFLLAKASLHAASLIQVFTSNPTQVPTERNEPSTARADGVLLVNVPPINPVPAAKPSDLILEGTIVRIYDSKTYSEVPKPSCSQPLPSTHEDCLMCPAVTEHLDSSSGTRPCLRVNPIERRCNASLCVPFFCVENKKDDKTVLQAFNQCRIYCISCVKLLAALGITGFPVYGLVTTGLQGTIMVAWNSQALTGKKGVVDAKDKCDFTVLMDSYLVSFDLTIPLEAYRFMLAVHRIYLYGLELQGEIKKQNLEDILKQPGFADWSMPPTPRNPKSQKNLSQFSEFGD